MSDNAELVSLSAVDLRRLIGTRRFRLSSCLTRASSGSKPSIPP